MFFSKKKRIKAYLAAKPEHTPFDDILQNWIDEQLEEKLSAMGLTKIEIHIDWLDDIKCIGIQGRYNKYFADIQIYPNEFSISFDLDEPDDDISYTLESKEQLYREISETIALLK